MLKGKKKYATCGQCGWEGLTTVFADEPTECPACGLTYHLTVKELPMHEPRERFKFMAVCQENCLAESSTQKTPSIQMSFQTTSQIVPGQEPIPTDRHFRADLWLTDATFARSIETLQKVFGWNGTDLQELADNRTLFTGKRVILVCEEEEYEGERRMKVCFINPISSVYAVPAERAKEIAEEFNSKLASFRSKSKAAKRTAADLVSTPPSTSAVDEELPF